MSPRKKLKKAYIMSKSRRKSKPTRKGRGGNTGRASEPAATPIPPGPVVVRLRCAPGEEGIVATIRESPKLARLAGAWMYVLRNRSRWMADEVARGLMRERALEDLEELGVEGSAIARMTNAVSRHVEVEIPSPPAPTSARRAMLDAAAAFPWEFVLTAATAQMGRTERLLVTRLLKGRRHDSQPPSSLSGLFVECAPGRLANIYSFETERARLNAVVGAHELSETPGKSRWHLSRSETPTVLRQRIERRMPNVIHVSGVDNHQVARLLPGFYEEDAIKKWMGGIPEDGIVMRSTPGPKLRLPDEVPVPFEEVATVLASPTSHGTAPRLITLNLNFSGSRIARECVAKGAQAALGFMDEIDEELAEFFFQAFYECWRAEPDPHPAAAFGHAWKLLKAAGKDLYGTGIAIWFARSVFEEGGALPSAAASEPDDDSFSRPGLPTLEQRTRTRVRPIEEILRVELDVPETLNYSLLHNSRPMLGTLTLSKLVSHPLDEVSVEVRLDIGTGSPGYRCTHLLITEPQRALANDVRIPLTAELLRSSRERIQGTVYVRVGWDNRVVFEQTRPITLLPVDEWMDDTANNPWLPSFVLPRDPAVAKIVAAARPHLIALQDDPDASFDGYQSVPEDITSPNDCDAVDQQVQAIWTALVHEFKLLYINPPPAYSETTQRLRTPAEIVATKSGTCIDLALLLASCLEYVDIYPVVVLLSGHAFVGYWRSEQYHEQFRTLEDLPSKSVGLAMGTLSAQSPVPLADTFGWRLARQQFAEIMEYHRNDRIRFIEATGMCFNYSYAEALKEGRGNMKVPGDFDSMLDIRLSRSATPPVTPLPTFTAHGT